MEGYIRFITFGQAVVSLFFLVLSIYAPVTELDAAYFIFSALATVSTMAFIVYASKNPVKGSEESTLNYFYVLLAANLLAIVLAVYRSRRYGKRMSDEKASRRSIKKRNTNEDDMIESKKDN